MAKTTQTRKTSLPWPIHGERIVAFIDMMGFKNMVDTWSTERLYGLMTEVFEGVAQITQDVRGSTEFEKDEILYKVNEPLARVSFFSDSIFIASAGCGDGSTLAVIMGALKSYYALLNAGVPCRGGIAKGECVTDFDKSVFFGQALIDAYLLGESLQFHGIAMEVGTFIQNPDEELEERTDEWIPMTHHCQTTLKDGTSKEIEIINWPAFMDSEHAIKTALLPFEHSDIPKLNGYYENTLDLALSAFRETFPNRGGN